MFDNFGVSNVHVVIRDQQGNIIESGDAFHELNSPDIWNYLTTVSVIVSAAATNRVGCMWVLSEEITIPESSETSNTDDL